MTNKKIVFNTDLDNTIIYSYKHDIGNDKRCVEIYQGREISFITQKTYNLLKKVREHILIVPTTTRTIEQYNRINLGIGNLKYSLVCNGGVLIEDGIENKKWYEDSLKIIEDSQNELLKAIKLLENEKKRSFEIRFIKELFVFTKCDEPEAVVEYLQTELDMSLVDVFNNGIKVYVVPGKLNKGNAINRLKKYIDADYCIAAGDSEFDISMIKNADFGIAASELTEHFKMSDILISNKIKCLPNDKLYSEAVLETIINQYIN